jgi:hypothetical protein
MSTKTKTDKIDTIAENLQNVGIGLMAVAATIGMVELPQEERRAIIVPHQPAFAFNEPANGEQGNNPLRREKENEVGQHFVSFNSVQRTPARSGKQ